MPDAPKVAVVIDALSFFTGAERVLSAVLEMYPNAPVFTLAYNPSGLQGGAIPGHEVHTSWIQKLPGGKTHYRGYLPLLPLAVEQLDLRGFDIVLSFNYAVAHGVICRPDQLHISYTFTPLRYAWQSSHEFFQRGPLSPLFRLIIHYLRMWDYNAASRVDHFSAVSKWTAACIRRAYRREAEVIYPPVETARFRPCPPRGDYYLAFSRLVRHKKLDMVLEAFSRSGRPLVVIGEGPERRKLERLAGLNIRLLGWQSDEAVTEVVGRAKALVHAAEEDFGMVMAEAQAAGCPVIGYTRGAASEIIIDGKTGLLFHEPTVASLEDAILRFENGAAGFNENDCIENARRFSKERFQKQFTDMVDREWLEFQLR